MDIFDQLEAEKKEKDIFDQFEAEDVFSQLEAEEAQKPKRKPAKVVAKDLMGQIAGLDKQPPYSIPFEAKHPNIAAAGKTLRDLPGQIAELPEAAGTGLVSGFTLGLSDYAAEAGDKLARELFGKGKPHGATGSWKESKLPPYIKSGAKIVGSIKAIGNIHSIISAPTVQLVAKSKYLVPISEMLGWGTTGATYEGLSKLIQEGELPTPKELAKTGAQWSLFSGAISALGWTGRLTIGVERLHKLWKIPRKEIIKTVLDEAKKRKMPIAKYCFVKGKAQKALSLKEAKSTDKLLKEFEKQGTYADLTVQLKDKEIESRISMFRKHIGETLLVGKKPKPKKVVGAALSRTEQILSKQPYQRTAEEIAFLSKTKAGIKTETPRMLKKTKREWIEETRPHFAVSARKQKIQPSPWAKVPKKVLAEDLPPWIKTTGEDIRTGRFVPKKRMQEYKEYFENRHSLYAPIEEKPPQVKILSKPTAINRVTLESPWGKKGAKVLKENLPAWVVKIGKDIRYGKPVPKAIIQKYMKYFEGRPSVYKPKMPVVKTSTIPKGKLKAALKYPNGEIVTGQTHLHCLQTAEKRGLDKQLVKGSARSLREGFVDSQGTFLSREEATRAYGAGEAVALNRMDIIGKHMDTRPVAKLLRRKIGQYRQRKYSDDSIQLKLRGEKFNETDIATAFMDIKNAKSGTYFGFGATGEIQRIYDKLAKRVGHIWHRQPAKKMPEQIKPKAVDEDLQILLGVLKKAKLQRAKQEILYTKARQIKLAKAKTVGKTTSGKKGFEQELKALGGEMPKIAFDPISKKMNERVINSLFDRVKNHPTLQAWEVYPARKGLAKLFGEYGGTVPTENELKLLHEVFGKELVQTIKKVGTSPYKNLFIDLVNLPKALRASIDISAGFRQGLFFLGRPKAWAPAFKDQIKYFVSPKSFKAAQQELTQRPMYHLAMENKLSLTELGKLSNREEMFASHLAEYAPGVKASSRAFTGFLNQLRVSVFEDLVNQGNKLGIKDPKYFRDVAKYINHATGRGSLLKLDGLAVELNTIFFSPRLIMSRLQLLNPVFYKNLHPTVRKEALKDLFSVASIALTTLGLAKMGGYDIENDPRSADFAKIKKGNTRYDILGGLQQPVRAAAQFITGTYISSVTGQHETLGEGYRPMTRLGIASRFFKNKLSPVVAFATKLMGNKMGSEGLVDVPTEIATLFVPMAAADLADTYNEWGQVGIPMATPAFLGVGVENYGGVTSYGLHGKDYPKINKELNRLKMSMGFPNNTVYNQQLSVREYYAYKRRTGKNITTKLNEILKMPYYKKASDGEKKQIISRLIDRSKEETKRKMFMKKKQIATLALQLKKTKHLTDSEALEKAKKQLNK